MTSPRATQKDVARISGFDQSTVSMALRNHPRIPEETRSAIQKVAQTLGYSPDPMLAGLAAYRNHQRPTTFHGTLAWFVNGRKDFAWETSPHFHSYFVGAQKQAKSLGYQIEVFDLSALAISKKRLASIFRARNIRGLLVCPQPEPLTELAFEWEDFSAITFGYSLAKPELHTIATSYFTNTLLIMRQLIAHGYRRIVYCNPRKQDERLGFNCAAGYVIENFLANEKLHPPLFVELPTSPKNIRSWYTRYKPDAIVTCDLYSADSIRKAGIAVPRKLGVVCPDLPLPDSPISGAYVDCVRMGEVAATLLIDMLQRGERGVPTRTLRTLVEGIWNPGTTIRKQESLSVRKLAKRKS